MTPLFALFSLGPAELLIVGAVGVLLFGKRLPEVGRSLGQGLLEFKKGLQDLGHDDLGDDAESSPSSAEPMASHSPAREIDYDETTAPKFEPPTHDPTAE